MIRKYFLPVSIVLILMAAYAGMGFGQLPPAGPMVDNLEKHAYPALGASAERKVEVAWNRFYDHAGLCRILSELHKAFPELTKLYSIGKSYEGREIWCLEVTARSIQDPKRKAGMYIDGNIHGNEVQGAETVAYTAWYLCHQYNRIPKITLLLDERVFYLLPTINPDGREMWFHDPDNALSSRSGAEPTDNDRDGLVDEDDYDDLNGDGVISLMRIQDPHGQYKPHSEFPDYLMERVKPGEKGQYRVVGMEGIDNDNDGRINEDRKGGYDMNRNWAYGWQPEYMQRGAKDYPFSQPETRVVAEFIMAHPNIAAFQSYHNAGGMILRPPGWQDGPIQTEDEAIMQTIARQGEKILPFYDSKILWRDLYRVFGGEFDWVYGGRGILAFTNELWSRSNLYRKESRPSDKEEIEFIKHVLLEEGLIPWQEVDHPTYGKVEVGGFRKEWGRLPPSFMLEEELHRNMAFTLYHADMMPLLKIQEVKVEKLGPKLHKIWVTVENQRLIPTRTSQDVKNHISRPDIISLRGKKIKVLSAGRVLDPHFKKVEAVERRPQRVEVDAIRGMQAIRIQFIVSGKGALEITVDSIKGGLLKRKINLKSSLQ